MPLVAAQMTTAVVLYPHYLTNNPANWDYLNKSLIQDLTKSMDQYNDNHPVGHPVTIYPDHLCSGNNSSNFLYNDWSR